MSLSPLDSMLPWKKTGSDPNRFLCEACGYLIIYGMTPGFRNCEICQICILACQKCLNNQARNWHCKRSGTTSNLEREPVEPRILQFRRMCQNIVRDMRTKMNQAEVVAVIKANEEEACVGFGIRKNDLFMKAGFIGTLLHYNKEFKMN